ncbi:MAG: hypothetical protein CFH41_00417 [Alphaproteobacteria bacterium MarineAlpha11_Bin1]|nr:MAG: hypothetical protein CFH41_00417 [Alphaproteobacteria bacterium MarineAlpha11_Bin1]|tara:strand:+ start:192 stop:437 length:246 start_codon:yes stop_codon:yes gene_type:complete
MKNFVMTICLVVGLAFSTAVQAQDQKPDVMIEQGAKMIFDALALVLKTIPQYEAPKILENGDILIRRKNPKTEKEEKEKVI